MNILYITGQRLEKDGGGSVHFKEIAHELTNLGKKVYVIGPRYGCSKPISWTVPLILVPLPGRNVLSVIIFEATLWFIMAFAIFRFRIDVVLDRGSFSGPFLYLVCRILRRKYVREVNGIADIEFKARFSSPAVFNYLFGKYISFVYRCADTFICVAPGIRDELTRRWSPFTNRSVVISNGVNESIFKPHDPLKCREELNLPEDKFIIGFVGQLNVWHGVESLIMAAEILQSRCKDKFLVIIVGGQGSRLNELKDKCIQMGLEESVMFTGSVKRDLIPYYTSSFDVACQVHNDPIIGRLGNSLKFWEYLACGIPIIVSDMSEASDWVAQNLVGWIFKGGDIDDLALKIEYAIRHPQEGQDIGKKNRNFIESGHRWKDVARRVADVLEP